MKKVALALILIIADQSFKYILHKSLLSFLWGGFFVNLTCNQNISWGIPLTGKVFFILWSLLATSLVLWARKTNWNIFLIIVLSGAISNLLDRIFYGCVIDYLALEIFPVFNFADVLIVGGMMLFLVKELGILPNKLTIPNKKP
jgi:signal peptidase II